MAARRQRWLVLIPISLVILALALSACSGSNSAPHGQTGALLPGVTLTPAATASPDTSTLTLVWASNGGQNMLLRPGGIAVDAQGNIYLCDCGHNRVLKLDASGQPVSAWGAAGAAVGTFAFMLDRGFGSRGPLAVDQHGNLYVADASDHVQKFDASGRFVAQWGSPGSGPGQLEMPSAVAVDRHGNVYVADSRANQVQVFDAQGKPLLTFGSPGSGPGQFSFPTGLAVDGHDDIYVADAGNNRIEKFDNLGNFLYQWSNPAQASQSAGFGRFGRIGGIAVDIQDNVYVVDNLGGQHIEKFDAYGKLLADWSVPVSASSRFRFLGGVAVDPMNNIYVVDVSGGRVEKLRPHT